MGNPVRHSNPSTTVVLVAIGFLALLISCGLVFIIIPIRDVSRSQPVEPSAPVLVHGLDELGAGQETITETLMAESASFVVYEIDSEGTDLKIFRIEIKDKGLADPNYSGSNLSVGLALVLIDNPEDELFSMTPITGKKGYGSSTQGLLIVLKPKAQ